MKLTTAKVGPFKSINSPQKVPINDQVTVLVGMNEAGKTIFLQALEKSNDALGVAKFDPVDDYPRKDLSAYLKQHKDAPAEATMLTYQLSESEVSEINAQFHTKIPKAFQFSETHFYNNTKRVTISVEERPVIDSLARGMSSDAKAKLKGVASMRGIPPALAEAKLTEDDKAALAGIEERIGKTEWDSVVAWEVWHWLS
jgi:ATPase subunit of ABC transporter with duplicated ATPase domains